MLAWKYQLSRTDLHVHRLCLLLLAILAIGVLTACSERKTTLQFKSTDITGTTIGGDFAMTDHTGQPRKLSDYKGKIVLLFFGFTHCPDVCPTTLSEAAGAKTKPEDVAFFRNYLGMTPADRETFRKMMEVFHGKKGE